MLHDTPARYGTLSKFLHWSMSLLFLWQLLKLGDRINDGEHWIGQTLVPFHGSIGLILLVMIVLRIVWSLKQRNQRPPYEPATAWLAKIGHFGLYVMMVLMPLSAILLMIGKGYGLKFFGMQLVARGPEIPWAASLGEFHSPLAWITLLLILGHIGAALFHRFVKRDDIMQRML